VRSGPVTTDSIPVLAAGGRAAAPLTVAAALGQLPDECPAPGGTVLGIAGQPAAAAAVVLTLSDGILAATDPRAPVRWDATGAPPRQPSYGPGDKH
jgi:hypothetical protein